MYFFFKAQTAIVAKAGKRSIKSSQSNPQNTATQIVFSLRAKSPALWKAGTVTSHYSNRETLVTPSAVIKSKNRKCGERHWVRSCGRPAGQAGFATLSCKKQKAKPRVWEWAPLRVLEHPSISSLSSALELPATFQSSSRQA